MPPPSLWLITGIDSRDDTRQVYWEGAVRVLDPTGTEIGLGYLELTGYHRSIRI